MRSPRAPKTELKNGRGPESSDWSDYSNPDDILEHLKTSERILALIGIQTQSPIFGPYPWVSSAGAIALGAVALFAPLESSGATSLLLCAMLLVGVAGLSFLSGFVYRMRPTPTSALEPTLGGMWLTRWAREQLDKEGNLHDVLRASRYVATKVWSAPSLGSTRAATCLSLAFVSLGVNGLVGLLIQPSPPPPSCGLVVHAHALSVAYNEDVKQLIESRLERTLPTGFRQARTNFETAWKCAALDEKRAVAPDALHLAFTATIRSYRFESSRDPTMREAITWSNASVHFFEEEANEELLFEALMDKVALLFEISQLQHTDPHAFRTASEEADQAAERAFLAADTSAKKSESLRFRSRIYYNLARPRDGDLSKNWSNDYLHVSLMRAKESTEIDPAELRHSTQYCRVLQKYARNEPQDSDTAWTLRMREALDRHRNLWNEREPDLLLLPDRIAPLNILAVLTMETVLREWTEADTWDEKLAATLLHDLETNSVAGFREILTALPNTAYQDYEFDFAFDLARAHAVRYMILSTLGSPIAESSFSLLKESFEKALESATATQRRAALYDLEGRPEFRALSAEQITSLRE